MFRRYHRDQERKARKAREERSQEDEFVSDANSDASSETSKNAEIFSEGNNEQNRAEADASHRAPGPAGRSNWRLPSMFSIMWF